jgi:tetratricopeptide (TPR) repeat protein
VSNIAKLKKQAAEFEQKRQFDKALAKYRQVLDSISGDLNEADVALYNRVGDLLLRQGNVSDAVIHYERAVDLYADGGFFSNAIALCNKILRTAPGRSSIYYKLGRISARKGFISDAKQNFLEYADRMRKSGQIDEAFRALKEFADLCPDQDDIRIMLADQLARDDRKEEAVEQLQLLYEKTVSEGRTTEAKAVLDRMRAIDPSVVPSTGKTPTSTPRAPSGLQFLMPDDAPPAGEHPRTPAPTPEAPQRFTPLESKAIGGLPLIHPDVDDIESEPVEGIERASAVDEEEPLSATPVAGLETAFYDAEDEPGQIAPLDDLELTAHQDEDELDDFSAITPEDELPEDEGGGALADLPMLLPDDTIVPVEENEADDHSPFIPEVESDEPEPIVLEVDDEPFQLEHSEDDLPLLGSDDAYAASEPEPQEPDSPWTSEQTLDEGSAVALQEPPETSERLTARIAWLRVRIAEDPADPELLRGLGEALIEAGERDDGIAQLEGAIWELERMGAFGKAYALANEILRVDPDAVRFHQKRVEFAFRTGEKPRLVEAYLGLADSLVRGGEVAKARVVYQRVIDLSPDDARARVALDTITDPTRPATPPAASVSAPSVTPAAPRPAVAPPAMPLVQQKPDARPVTPPRPSTPPAGGVRPSSRPTPVATEFIDLAAWMDEDEQKKSTRMVAEGVTEPENEAQADFADMLERFKEGVAANLDEGDFQSHYDLGIAYREMGLLDEAIAEFQKALRSTDDRVKTYEALGQCFIEKQHYPIAITLLARALNDGRNGDETLIGVLYMLGSACEAVGRHAEARGYYERVYAVDIRFRDVNDRLAAVAQVAQ